MIKYKLTENEIYAQFFSFDVLDYFDSIATDENFEWIEKYFNVLMKDKNVTSEKFNIHHIRPCFTFKDTDHKNRKQTKPLGDNFNGNLIKLSIYNHLFAHFYLWKIFNGNDSKTAFQHMCNQGKYINNLTEEELDKIARLKENCAKENLTDDEKKEHQKNSYMKYINSEKGKNYMREYEKNNKNNLLEYQKEYYIKNKDNIKEKRKKHYKENCIKIYERKKNYRKNNPQKILEQDRKYRKKYHERLSKRQKNYDNQKCIDPTKGDECTLCALRGRIRRNKEKYINVNPIDCIIKNTDKIFYSSAFLI